MEYTEQDVRAAHMAYDTDRLAGIEQTTASAIIRELFGNTGDPASSRTQLAEARAMYAHGQAVLATGMRLVYSDRVLRGCGAPESFRMAHQGSLVSIDAGH